MIVIVNEPDRILISGHAKYGVHGKDIICAAVSVLAQNLISSIEELTNDKVEYHIQPGHIDINLKDLSEQGKFLVDSFFVGISRLEDSCGQEYLKSVSR